MSIIDNCIGQLHMQRGIRGYDDRHMRIGKERNRMNGVMDTASFVPK